MPVETYLIKLIRKLRWIGRDDEARELEKMLSHLPPTYRGCILAEPTNTD
jgi:hypothetical protein